MTTWPGQTSSRERVSEWLSALRYWPTGSAWPAARRCRRASSAAPAKSGNHGISAPSGPGSAAGQPGGDLLDQPAVAVRVAERRKRTIALVLRGRASHPRRGPGVVEHPGAVVEDLADLGAPLGQFGARLVDVAHR